MEQMLVATLVLLMNIMHLMEVIEPHGDLMGSLMNLMDIMIRMVCFVSQLLYKNGHTHN